MESLKGIWNVHILLILTAVYVAGQSGNLGFTVNNEVDLKDSLLSSSGIQTIRPTKITMVELAYNLLSINNVDIKNEQLQVSGWWSVKWTDNRLSWTHSNYTNFPVIQVTSSDIWKPALVVDNSVNDLSAIDDDTIPIRVRQDGQVTWNPPGILTTYCEMVVTYFPFDRQVCSIQVTSWGYTIQELNVSVMNSGISTSYYKLNGEWNLISTWNERQEITNDGYTYAMVTFYVELERLSLYYGLNTMLPVLLTSLLLPLVFLLPHDSGEKIGYCLTVLLAYVVILTLVTDALPTTAKTQSLLGVYIALVLSMSGCSVFLAIHSLNIFHRDADHPISAWQMRLTKFVHKFNHLHFDTLRRRYNGCVTPVLPAGKGGEKENLPGDKQVFHGAGEDEETITWQFMAVVYDAFWFRFYFTTIICFSVAFLLATASTRF